jgi:hypothetical protein
VPAKHLRNGDEISTVDADGTACKQTIIHSIKSDPAAPVFNLVIADNFTFVASNSVVHSFTYFRRLRMMYWRLVTAALGEIFDKCSTGASPAFPTPDYKTNEPLLQTARQFEW